MSKKSIEDNQRFETLITRLIKDKKPKNLEQLVKSVRNQIPGYTESEIIERFLYLQKGDKVSLKEIEQSSPQSLRAYVFSDGATWFWIVSTLGILTIAVVLTIPENAFPIVYARYGLGITYVLFLPGYCFVRAFLLPKKPAFSEQIIFSLALSIFFSFVVGLLLNYSPWRITLVPTVFSLLALTLGFSTIALFREYQSKFKHTP